MPVCLQGGLRGIGHLSSLRSLVLELASPGTTLGDRVTRQYHTHNPLLVPFTLVGEIGSELSAAAGSMGVPLLGTNPILAFAAPPEWGIINRVCTSAKKQQFTIQDYCMRSCSMCKFVTHVVLALRC